MSEETHGGGWEESEDSSAVAVQDQSAPVTAPDEYQDSDDQEGDVHAPVEASDEDEPATRDEKGRYRKAAERAGPKDVGRINALTRKLRTAEEELQRVRAQVPQTPPPAPPPQMAAEPTIEQFADRDDPYGAWQRALATWDRTRERVDEQTYQYQQRMQQHQYQQQQAQGAISAAHQQRILAAAAADPTVSARLSQVTEYIPQSLDEAIMLDNDSANVALFLADHQPVLDELTLLAAMQPYSSAVVGKIQRVLRQRMNAAGSGSASASPLFVPAPRPPNPLLTALINTGADMVPSDDNMSLEAHEKAFPVRRRRR